MQATQAETKRVSLSVPTSNYTDNLKASGDLVPAFGNVPDAITNVESLQRLSAVMTAFGGKEGQAFDIAKALETRGAANSPDRFRRDLTRWCRLSKPQTGRWMPVSF